METQKTPDTLDTQSILINVDMQEAPDTCHNQKLLLQRSNKIDQILTECQNLTKEIYTLEPSGMKFDEQQILLIHINSTIERLKYEQLGLQYQGFLKCATQIEAWITMLEKKEAEVIKCLLPPPNLDNVSNKNSQQKLF